MTRVQDLMSPDVRTVTPDTEAGTAWEAMRNAAIHHLVVMEGRQVVGIVSARDLAGAKGAAFRKGLVVADLMTEGVVTVPPDTPVRKAANLMRGKSIGCLVVMAKAKVAGIVTVSDLLALLGSGAAHAAPPADRRVMKARAPRIAQNRPRVR